MQSDATYSSGDVPTRDENKVSAEEESEAEDVESEAADLDFRPASRSSEKPVQKSYRRPMKKCRRCGIGFRRLERHLLAVHGLKEPQAMVDARLGKTAGNRKKKICTVEGCGDPVAFPALERKHGMTRGTRLFVETRRRFTSAMDINLYMLEEEYPSVKTYYEDYATVEAVDSLVQANGMEMDKKMEDCAKEIERRTEQLMEERVRQLLKEMVPPAPPPLYRGNT